MASCIFLGGAVHPRYVGYGEQERQIRMATSVKNDIGEMFKFAAGHSQVVVNRQGSFSCLNLRQVYRHDMKVKSILLNEDISNELHRQVSSTVTGVGGAQKPLFDSATLKPYTSKYSVRHEIRSFLQNDLSNNLIIFMTGHGGQRMGKDGKVVESFLLPQQGSAITENYTDADLTQDIVNALPSHKKLYIVMHCCHSGGMVNFWQLDTNKQVALFASAEADLLAEWSSEGDTNFVGTFCSKAGLRAGKRLNAIADEIYQTLHRVPTIRPVFKTTRPSMAEESFLS
ncbi:uncharacterized protein LOC135817839 isoform X1 [Sycon ciliatum]|uniref:uncharacterized protein LOC135817839 isoform X1 n=1 Tax=Sycon ciliatum TaxID=27933 RepID=UPI0031F6679A